MTRAIAVLRPEPGNRLTAAAIEARGYVAIRLPLFDVRPIAWEAPDPSAFDALILTSANAVRHGGAELRRVLGLPVYAVGDATAAAARRAGFAIASISAQGAAALVEQVGDAGVRRALHLAGRERTIERGGIVADVRTVYASVPLPIADSAVATLAASVVLVQSARAARRLDALARPDLLDRSSIAIAALSEPVARSVGTGWRAICAAPEPSSGALLALALALAD